MPRASPAWEKSADKDAHDDLELDNDLEGALRPPHAEATVLAQAPRPTSRLSDVVTFLTPELFSGGSRASTTQQLRSTAYLDGLRGFAALVVYIAHNILSANGLLAPLEVAFGFEGAYYLVNLPFLRMLFTGSHASVPIFFIVSGFVQTRRALQLIHAGDPQVGTVLASAIFRRGFRLLIPVLGTSFCFMTLWHLLGVRPFVGHYEETFLADLRYFFVNMWYWTYIFKTNDIKLDDTHTVSQWFAYNGHTWTVPIELQGSFHVLILMLVYARATPRVRMAMLALTSTYFLLEGGVYWFCFPIGAVLGEADLLARSPDSFLLPSTFPYRRALFYGLLALGLYLGGVPVRGFAVMSPEAVSHQPGFYYLSHLIPRIYFDVTHFLGTLSALCLVTATIALPRVQRLFEGRAMQYLGRLSFSLYLCHGPLLATLGMRLYRVFGKLERDAAPLPLPLLGPVGLELPFWAANLILLPVTLYASELCGKLFDGPSVRLSQWAWRQVSG